MSKKTFFITGANSGFALAIATAASKQGHTVVGTIRSEASRASLAKHLPTVRAVLCDVIEFNRIPDVVEQAEADHGPVDVLINNAGYGHEGIRNRRGSNHSRIRVQWQVSGKSTAWQISEVRHEHAQDVFVDVLD